ncbi:hypothetical protein [Streptomyces sp. NPDC058295]|uniref:hypothetical protein n=1 Tax=Streptomyces sp. NPDC058295 TaxID=3346431 RepID=UPI0036E392D8
MSGLDDTLDDLSGFGWIPGLDQMLDGIRIAKEAAANGELSLDAAQTLLTLLGNPDGPDLPEALAGLAADVTNPATNPTLDELTQNTNPDPDEIAPDTVKELQRLGEQHVRDTADYTPRDHTNEAAALISGI